MNNPARITADSGKIREFLIKVNTDAKFRSNFFEDPTTTLERFEIHLTPDAKEEVEVVVKALRENIKKVSALPHGYEEVVKDLGYNGEDPNGFMGPFG